MYFLLYYCLLLTIMYQVKSAEVEMMTSDSDTDTVPFKGYCEPNTVGNGKKALEEEIGQELIEKLENIVTLQNGQADANMIKTFDLIMRKLCQFKTPDGNMRKMYGIQYAKFAQHFAQMCGELQQKASTNAITIQQIYAAIDIFGGPTNTIKSLDNMEQQIVAQLRKQKEPLSMELRNKLFESAKKFGGENLTQKLKTIIVAKTPSEQLALTFEMLKDVAQQQNPYVVHHRRYHLRAKRDDNLEQAIAAVVAMVLVGLVVIACVTFVIKNVEVVASIAVVACILAAFIMPRLQPARPGF